MQLLHVDHEGALRPDDTWEAGPVAACASADSGCSEARCEVGRMRMETLLPGMLVGGGEHAQQ